MAINSGTFKPFVSLEYSKDLANSADAGMHYNLGSTHYTLKLDEKSDRSWKLGLGADLVSKDSWNGSIAYQREQVPNRGYQNNLNVNLDLKF